MQQLKNKFITAMAVFAIAFCALALNSYAHNDLVSATRYFAFAAMAFLSPVGAHAASSLGTWGEPAGIAALKRNWNRLGFKTQAEAANIQGIDDTIYIRKSITGISGVYRLIDASNVKTAGITNIDKNRFPEGYNLGIEGIRVAQGSHATITDPKNIINYTAVNGSVEAEFRHAELVITQDSKELLRLPISSMLAPAATTIGTLKEAAYSLKDNAIVLVETLPFEINIEFPAAVATSSASSSKFHVEVELYGKKTVRKFV